MTHFSPVCSLAVSRLGRRIQEIPWPILAQDFMAFDLAAGTLFGRLSLRNCDSLRVIVSLVVASLLVHDGISTFYVDVWHAADKRGSETDCISR